MSPALVSSSSYDTNAEAAFVVIFFFVVAIAVVTLVNILSSREEREETERIRSLGVRVVTTVIGVIEEVQDESMVTRLQSSWFDPAMGQTLTLTSQVIPSPLARSYRSGDPVVVFIDPSHPVARCRFVVNL